MVATPKGWHSRGYLPHFDGGVVVQSVTFRLADSFPTGLLAAWEEELRYLTAIAATQERRRRIERFLDAGHGESYLGRPELAALVEEALLYFDARRYALHAWVIMPNHVHAVLTPSGGDSLGSIVGSWKSYTAHQANRLLRRSGAFWAEDYFDRFIRSDAHFSWALKYVEDNPVKAGLCLTARDWTYSSARRRPPNDAT